MDHARHDPTRESSQDERSDRSIIDTDEVDQILCEDEAECDEESEEQEVCL